MSNRLNHFQTVPGLIKELMNASGASHKSSLDSAIKNLIEIRASQLNGCAFCLDMHIKQGKIRGEKDLRLFHVSIWRESPLFTAKEKIAFEITEALTQISAKDGLNDELYTKAKEHFSDVEISELTFAIGLINMWNRLQIVSQMTPGSQDQAFGLTKAGLN